MGRGTGLSPVCDGMYVCVYILPFTNRPTDAVSHSQAQNKQLQDLVHSVVSSLYTNVSRGASPTGEASTSAMRHAAHHPPVEEGDSTTRAAASGTPLACSASCSTSTSSIPTTTAHRPVTSTSPSSSLVTDHYANSVVPPRIPGMPPS